MANTTSLQSLLPRETKNTLSKMIGGTFEDLAGDIFESVIGVDKTPDSPEAKEPIATPVPEYVKKAFGSGSIENFNKARPKTDEQLLAKQRAAVIEAESILKQSRAEFVIQEEVRYEVAGMPEKERNERLHLNTSFAKAHTETPYHTAELYGQKKAELVRVKQANEATEIPSPAKQPNSLEVAFEGKTGSKGNLSFQAVG